MSRQHSKPRASILSMGMALAYAAMGLIVCVPQVLAQVSPVVPPPAYGQDGPTPITQTPPVTSLDEPSLEPGAAARSYLQPGVHLTETINSNLNNAGVVGITRVLGSLDVKRLWSRFAFTGDYIGGLALYSDTLGQPAQVHSLDAAQKYSWRTGSIQVRDSLSYLPEGSFGFSGINVGGGGGGGNQSYGSLGTNPRLTNAAGIDAQESLNPRSTITLGGSYSFTDFKDFTSSSNVNANGLGTENSHSFSGQLGYSRILNRFDQVGVSYGFQKFQFPVTGAGAITANVIQVLYAHQISGRMSLILGVGPQFTHISARKDSQGNTTPATDEINANVRASLRYRFPRSSFGVTYSRYTSSGSGLQLGSNTDAVRGTWSKPLSRLWTGTLDGGYSHHTALQAGLGHSLGGSFQDDFAGGGLSRRIGRFFSFTSHYQYSYETFSGQACGLGKVDCTHSFNRHLVDVGLSWHPAPIRLD